MKAIVIHGKQDLREQVLPVPAPAEGQVRVRIAYVGICGSDLHYYFEGANGEYVVREPLVPGHELSGVIDEDPAGVYEPGTPVTLHPATFGRLEPGLEDKPHLWPDGAYLGSASTWPHTQGAMSEYLVVDRSAVRVLPQGLPLRRAALAEPLAVALHGISLAGGVKGKSVLVSGAGPIGLLSAVAALSEGAAEVTASDVLPGPLDRARGVGVHHAVQVGTEDLPKNAFDVVLECSGVPAALTAALEAVRRAGNFVQLGMLPNTPAAVNLAPLVSKEVTVHGSFRFNDEIDQAVRLLDQVARTENVITHEFTSDRAQEAFDLAKDSEVSGKVVVSF